MNADKTSMNINDDQASSSLDAFVWPVSDCPLAEHGSFASEADVPTIDLSSAAAASGSDDGGVYMKKMVVAEEIGRACRQSGFFQVINHGVDQKLINQVHENARDFFRIPESAKLQAARVPGNSFGFAGKFAGRFRSKCPWKETFSLQYSPVSNIKDYLVKVYKEQHRQHCLVYEAFCEAMEMLGRQLVQLIAQSLELPPDAFDEYFDTQFSIFRLNMYPPSEHFSQLLGTGPHTDPCALTILHQDHVGGLQVFRNDTWVTVQPRSDAFVISIGDTLQTLCNHRYKSAKHRAVIHAAESRQSIVFFINPGLETVIKPVPQLVSEDHPAEKHAEFNWGQLLEFTQKHYRTDVHTLDAFANHLRAEP